MVEAQIKAKELIEKYRRVKFSQNKEYNEMLARQCALICVDEILATLNHQNPNFEDNTYWSPIDFWKQVRESTLAL